MKQFLPGTESLAIDGGQPVRVHPFPGWPEFDAEQQQEVCRVLSSGKVNYWTGSEGRAFEREFADLIGTRHAVAVANGTLALELALYALDIGPGDEVVVPPRTFVATATAVLMRGARPVFADVDPVSGNLTADTIAPCISPATKGIICVHLAGWPCEMEPIRELANRHGIRVIEDCAQAHGARYHAASVGTLSDIAAFSFCQDKIISTGGEGGMVVTNDERLWKRAWSFKDHGKDWDTVYHGEHPGIFRWLHNHVGTNWRLTEMQSAIGRIQLGRLDGWVERRRTHAERLSSALEGYPGVEVPQPPAHVRHSYYRYYFHVHRQALQADWSRDRIVRALQAEGIPCGTGSCSEIYLERGLQSRGLAPARPCLASRELGERSVALMVHPTLQEQDLEDVVRALDKVLGQALTSYQEPLHRAA